MANTTPHARTTLATHHPKENLTAPSAGDAGVKPTLGLGPGERVPRPYPSNACMEELAVV